MNGEVRRQKILELLKESDKPVSGTRISKEYGVSRQVIVQDIALLRAENKNILATNKGYIMHDPESDQDKCRRTYGVKHTKEQIKDELYTIVDCGGKVLDVVVDHDIYGQITVDLIVNNRQDVDEFVDKVNNNKVTPLKELTHGIHFHTVEAANKERLDLIEKKLLEKGYLIKE